jgi:hypothetical protein
VGGGKAVALGWGEEGAPEPGGAMVVASSDCAASSAVPICVNEKPGRMGATITLT